MEDKIYKITLSDGTVLDNLRLNGNNFISDKSITEDMLFGKLNNIQIEDSKGNVEIHKYMELIQIMQYENEYWFILRDVPVIQAKRALLKKYKYDVEQVDLFGMQRDDYEEKKALCAQLVLELKELEK